MKKLLGILVLGLLLSGNAQAQLITLKECYTISFKSSDGRKGNTYKSFKDSQKIINEVDDQLYTLDTVMETITHTYVWTDFRIDEWYKEYGTVLPKIQKEVFKIVDLGGNVASAEAITPNSFFKENRIDVDFEGAKVYSYMVADVGAGENTVSKTEQCKKQK